MLSRGTHRFYDNVRSVRDLDSDLAGYDSATFPKVLWIEPEYTLGWSNGDDDHPPAAVRDGQEFLGKLYKVFRKKKDFWSKTLMIVTYDEHGGFFDHLPPLPVVTNPPGGLKRSYPDFTSSGIRVPGFLISPYVLPQSLYSGNVDHTSILKLIGARSTLQRCGEPSRRGHSGRAWACDSA
jgi:phospholipase C